MASQQKDNILATWKNKDDLSIIKEAAEKGRDVISTCIEFLASKRKITLDESSKYFYSNANAFIYQLISQKEISKSVIVIKNLERNVKNVLYEFAFTTTQKDIQDSIFNYLNDLNRETFSKEKDDYFLCWNIRNELQKCQNLLSKGNNNLMKFCLEDFVNQSNEYKEKLITEIYFETRNIYFIDKLEKHRTWKYIILENLIEDILFWLNIVNGRIEPEEKIHQKYSTWSIEKDMFDYVIENLKNPSDTLRNCFIELGFIFPDEKENIPKILSRIFSTESYQKNLKIINNLAICKYLVENQLFSILLENFITIEDIKQLKIEFPKKCDLFEFIISLKLNNLDKLESIAEISQSAAYYLNKEKFYENYPSILLKEFLLKKENLDTLIQSPRYKILKDIPFISSYLKNCTNNYDPKIKFPIDYLFKQQQNIDLKEITKYANSQPISFSNQILSEKYSQNIKLNYLHYLKQYRSSYAVYCFLIEQLSNYSQISRQQIYSTVEIVSELAINNYKNDELILHCIAFIEILGFDSKNIRAYIYLIKMIKNAGYNEINNPEELLKLTEEILLAKQENLNEFPLKEFSIIMQIVKCFQYKFLPELYFKSLIKTKDWWKLLILFQYYAFPINEIRKIVKKFDNIGDHIIRALSYENCNKSNELSKRRSSFSRINTRKKVLPVNGTYSQTTSGETMTSSISSSNEVNSSSKKNCKLLKKPKYEDLFGIILASTTNTNDFHIETFTKLIEIIKDQYSYSTSINLLKNSISYKIPILSVLAAVVSDINLVWCWTIWIASSIGYFENRNIPKTNEIFPLDLIEICVRLGYLQILHQSFQIFYEESQFQHLTKIFLETSKLNFAEDLNHNFQLYFLAWSNDAPLLPMYNEGKDYLLTFSIKLMILHLKYNFMSLLHQQNFLNIICQAGISDISQNIDFHILKNVLDIISFTQIEFDIEQLIAQNLENKNKYESLCTILQEQKEFEKAIKLAMLLNLSIDEIVYNKWEYQVSQNENDFDFTSYEKEADLYGLPPQLLVNFYLYMSTKVTNSVLQNYFWLKGGLEIIKKHHLFPNECFDRDQMEYDMMLNYLQSDLSIEKFNIYHSDYFEQILSKERCVLYKSFYELKELAFVEELNPIKKLNLTVDIKERLKFLLDKLLDDGDIVQALRIQAMFDYRTVDLHFLVFCMALAEGLTTIYQLAKDEREMLIEMEKTSFTKFNRRTLGIFKNNTSNSSSSPVKTTDCSDNSSTFEFEEIPSREKQEIVEALQGLASKLKHGINLGKRIVTVYRAAMYLDRDYIDILKTKDAMFLLHSVTEEDCIKKLVVINDIFSSMEMSQNEIADFIAHEIVSAIIKPRFYISRTEQTNDTLNLPIENILWGLNLDKEFHLVLELCTNTTFLGNALLDYCDSLKTFRKYQDNLNCEKYENFSLSNCTFDSLRQIILNCVPINNSRTTTTQVLSHKKQNTIYVELLIKAHDCFVHECSMEGIANILNRTKSLNQILSLAKSWKLIVRMLTGIGRYREMYYCFETLIKNEQFESLLGQFDEEKANGLRNAIIFYLNENYPDNQEYLKLTALHFLMYKKLAEMWENEAKSMIAKLLSNYLVSNDQIESIKETICMYFNCSPDLINSLENILQNLIHATENYLLDNKLKLASRSSSNAELVAMQIDLIINKMNTSSQVCLCVLNIQKEDVFKELVNNYLSIPQALILERAYSFEINWAESLFNQFVLQGKIDYFTEFYDRLELTDRIIEVIVKNFQLQRNITPQMEFRMSNLVEKIESVSLKYRLASILGFKNIITTLINEESIHYLRDTDYGKNEYDFPDF